MARERPDGRHIRARHCAPVRSIRQTKCKCQTFLDEGGLPRLLHSGTSALATTALRTPRQPAHAARSGHTRAIRKPYTSHPPRRRCSTRRSPPLGLVPPPSSFLDVPPKPCITPEETLRQAEVAISDYMNGFDNSHRRHSAMGWKCPAAFDRRGTQKSAAAAQKRNRSPVASRRNASQALLMPFNEGLVPSFGLLAVTFASA